MGFARLRGSVSPPALKPHGSERIIKEINNICQQSANRESAGLGLVVNPLLGGIIVPEGQKFLADTLVAVYWPSANNQSDLSGHRAQVEELLRRGDQLSNPLAVNGILDSLRWSIANFASEAVGPERAVYQQLDELSDSNYDLFYLNAKTGYSPEYQQHVNNCRQLVAALQDDRSWEQGLSAEQVQAIDQFQQLMDYLLKSRGQWLDDNTFSRIEQSLAAMHSAFSTPGNKDPQLDAQINMQIAGKILISWSIDTFSAAINRQLSNFD